jgi:hypothetical protein
MTMLLPSNMSVNEVSTIFHLVRQIIGLYYARCYAFPTYWQPSQEQEDVTQSLLHLENRHCRSVTNLKSSILQNPRAVQ